jgi:hypothetical protein
MQRSLPSLRIGNFLFLTAVFVLVLTCALRTSGLDYQSYFQEYNDQTLSVSGEIGYRLLISLLSAIAPFSVLLAIANITFFISHRPIWKEARNLVAGTCLLSYVIYIGVFLLMGSPRRLIAYSVVTPIIIATIRRQPLSFRSFLRIFLGAAFHTSALITLLYLLVGKSVKQLWLGLTWKRGFLIVGFIAAFAVVAFFTGLYDFIFAKFYYYIVYAGDEQEYLTEVPSILSGVIKRAVVVSLLLFGAWRNKGNASVIGFRLILIEALLYVMGSLISPVIAVVSSYFVVGYLLVALEVANSRATYLRKFGAMTGCVFFFLPTAIGLINMFPNEFGF